VVTTARSPLHRLRTGLGASALAAALSLGVAWPAHAQPAAKAAKRPDPKKRASDGRREFDDAMRLYQAGRHADACPLFERAVELSNRRPSALRALAQCQRALGTRAAAIVTFREYVATQPTPADAPAIEETIRALEAEEAAAQLAANPPPPPPPAPIVEPAPIAPAPALVAEAPPPAQTAWGPIVLVGASVAMAAGGAVLLAMGQSDVAAVEGAAQGSRWADVSGAADRAPTLNAAGLGLLGGAAIAAGLGLTWWLAE
jgi:tetratricopeptide (TPR) repeat protein